MNSKDILILTRAPEGFDVVGYLYFASYCWRCLHLQLFLYGRLNMAKKTLTAAEVAAKDLNLNKNQLEALKAYEASGKDISNLIRNKTVYQIGNNLGDNELIRLYFKEV